MTTILSEEDVRALLRRELPRMLESDPEVREAIVRLARPAFAERLETESRFDRLLDELRRDREAQSRQWDEQSRKWDEQNRKWEEQNRKWEENQKTINRILTAIENLSRKHDSTIGALGARWSLHAEESFRAGLKGILEDLFAVQVLHVVDFDEQGEVFGRPDQVELDVVIKNGLLVLCEIKSSMSKPDMYAFERKARFYEKRHARQADRRLVISPMVDKAAQTVARQLGIPVYSYAGDVDPVVFGGEGDRP